MCSLVVAVLLKLMNKLAVLHSPSFQAMFDDRLDLHVSYGFRVEFLGFSKS